MITFGSPCQDLSVAGKRAGLKHADNGDDETTRSGLFMEAVRIIKEMRRATNGEYPKFCIWENVPGAFSSNKGEDFRTVLEELIKICEPEAPPLPPPGKAGWPYADCIVGDGFSLAWRVFNAQHWGVAQRRRRVYALLDLTGECAEKVLFEREGLRGYYPPQRPPREDPAGNAETSAGGDHSAPATTYSVDQGAGKSAAHVHDELSPTLTCANDGAPAVCYAVATQQSGAEVTENGVCPTITAAAGMSGNNQPWICSKPVFCKSSRAKTKDDSTTWKPATVANTLNTFDLGESRTNELVFEIAPKTWDARGNGDGDICNAITGDHENRITDYTSVVCYWDGSQTAGTLTANNASGAQRMPDKENFNCVIEQRPIVLDRAFYNQGINAKYEPQYYDDGTVPTIVAKGPSAVCVRYIVRRLTPTECARLQGFPDRWGDIPQKENLTDEEYSFWLNVRQTHATINGKATREYTREQMLKWYNKLHSDSSEYKMWGNGIALPNALYVLQGIAEETKA